MWLRNIWRYARKREPSKMLLPCIRSFQFCSHAKSGVPRSAFRVCAAPSSSTLTSWAADSNGTGLKLAVAKSSWGVVKMVRPKPVSWATWGASLPSGIDLGWGAKSGLSNGTRSSVVRVFFISSSNSGNKNSLISTGPPLFSHLLLRTLVKRRRNHLALYRLVADFHRHFAADGGVLQGHVGQRDVLLQEWRVRTAGDVADLLALQIEHLVAVARNAAIHRLQANQRALDAFVLGALQRRAAGEVAFLHLEEALQAGFPHIDRVGNLMPVERQPAFQAKRVARAQPAGNNAELLARFHHLVPNAGAGRLVGGNVNFEAIFSGVPRSRNQDVRQPANRAMREPIELHLGQVGIGQFLQRVYALGPLNRDLGVVVAQVLDFAIELAGVLGDPVDVLLARAGVNHQHVIVFAHTMHNHVIHERSLRVQHGRIPALADRHPGGVVHGDEIG